MSKVFHHARQTHVLGDTMMMTGLVLLLLGVLGGYAVDTRLALSLQVMAHLLIIAGPTLIKIGYVMRINARQRLHLAY